MAAIAAASRGAKVTVLEQMGRPGLKLLATGGGRCNLTNTAPREAMMAAFGRQGRFMSQALAAMGGQALREFFAGLGVPTVCPDGFEVYPASQKAADVLDALLRRCRQLGVEVRCNQTVAGMLLHGAAQGVPRADSAERQAAADPAPHHGALSGEAACRSALFADGVRTGQGELHANRVILCCGGKSYPALGATGVGYDLARQAGHTIVPPTPAGVGLICRDEALRECAGVSLKGVRVWIDLPKFARAGRRGDVLFTHRGLSGPAVLDLSGDVAELLDAGERGSSKSATQPVPLFAVPLRIDLTPDEPKEAWLAKLDEWGHRQGSRQVRSLLAPRLTQAVAEMICQLGSVSPIAPVAHIDRSRRDAIVRNIKSLPVAVSGTEGFERAIVTRGGVSLKEVDPRTLESRRIAGLHFAGELLDLDGPCGGYNLTWAFASGHLAGLSASKNRD